MYLLYSSYSCRSERTGDSHAFTPARNRAAVVTGESGSTVGSESAAGFPSIAGTAVAAGLDLIVDRLNEASHAQSDANRAHARLWTALAELMRLARANPHVYL